jgi:hypothetical protein
MLLYDTTATANSSRLTRGERLSRLSKLIIAQLRFMAVDVCWRARVSLFFAFKLLPNSFNDGWLSEFDERENEAESQACAEVDFEKARDTTTIDNLIFKIHFRFAIVFVCRSSVTSSHDNFTDSNNDKWI